MPHARTILPRPAPVAALLLAVPLLAAALPARASVIQPADGSQADADQPAPWATVSVSSGRSVFDLDGRRLSVALATGDHASFSRTSGWGPIPQALSCTFDLAIRDVRTRTDAAEVLRFGSGFTSADADEPDARTIAALAIGSDGSGE